MIRKPWPIIIMALLFFLMPFLNILCNFLYLTVSATVSDYVYSLFFLPENYLALFDMVVPSLVAGIAIYSVKKWSYPVFLVCMLWIAVETFRNFSLHMGFIEMLFVWVIPIFFNFFYVSYILLPEVRAAYFDPRLRWWETKPRYVFSTDLEIKLADLVTQAKVTNVSEGGLLAAAPQAFQPNTIVDLKFNVLETELNLKAKVVYQKPDGSSHGLQFYLLTRAQKKLLKDVIQRLADENYDVIRPVPIWTEDLHAWFNKLIKTGKGLVPELPENYKKKS